MPACPDLLGRVDLLRESPKPSRLSILRRAVAAGSTEQVDDQGSSCCSTANSYVGSCPVSHCDCSSPVITKTKEPSVELHEVAYQPHVWSELGSPALAFGVPSRVSDIVYPAPSLLGCGGCPFREPCRLWPG